MKIERIFLRSTILLFEWPGRWDSPGSYLQLNSVIVPQSNGDFHYTFGTSSENLVMLFIWYTFISIHFTTSKLDKERTLNRITLVHI